MENFFTGFCKIELNLLKKIKLEVGESPKVGFCDA
jgi:hypothetical protein